MSLFHDMALSRDGLKAFAPQTDLEKRLEFGADWEEGEPLCPIAVGCMDEHQLQWTAASYAQLNALYGWRWWYSQTRLIAARTRSYVPWRKRATTYGPCLPW